MSSLTAVVHTHNDALRLGRCLETLHPCDRIVIVDHGSQDRTLHVAREYGARIVIAGSFAPPAELRGLADWLLCLDPRESLTEALAASLFALKSATVSTDVPFSVLLREETSAGWVESSQPQTRLVPSSWSQWNDGLPTSAATSRTLEGWLLRFAFP
jgi:glycosyltransferase involved in cell wall biosynthesis